MAGAPADLRLLEVHRLMAAAGDELDAVIADQLPGCAVFSNSAFHGPPRSSGGERRAAVAREAGMVIEDVDHPRRRSVGEGDLGAVDLRWVRSVRNAARPVPRGAGLAA